MGQGRQSRTVETLSLVLHAPACQGLENFFSFHGWSAVIRLLTFRNIRFMSELIPQLTPQLFNGLSLGAIYELITIGYTMVYGIIGMINFAHSQINSNGAYVGLFTLSAHDRN